MNRLKALIPVWASDWIDIIIPTAQIALILVLAITLHYITRKLINRAATHYKWPLEMAVPIKGLVRWFIIAGTILLMLERLGVSATVLWTAFSGFAAVGAVAFFAAWSVLSNFFLRGANLYRTPLPPGRLHRSNGRHGQTRRQRPCD